MWNFQVQTRMRCRFPQRESRADFKEVSLGLEIDGVRWFLSRGKHLVLEARSILYAIRYAENSYPSGFGLAF